MTSRRSQSLAQLERDAALARVGRTRRWVLAGAAALTAGAAALVSAVAPGRSLGAKTHVTAQVDSRAAATPKTSSRGQMPPLASAADLGLQGPSESPQPSPAPDPSAQAPQDQSQAVPNPAQVAPAPSAPVVSGGS
jgi:hypothetical protein